jgi:hypothetical protein
MTGDPVYAGRTRSELAALVAPVSAERVADYLADARRDYERKLEKLDAQAEWIGRKMESLRTHIANAKESQGLLPGINALDTSRGGSCLRYLDRCPLGVLYCV